MRAITATANLLLHVKEKIMGSPLTHDVPHSVEALLNSSQIQDLTASKHPMRFFYYMHLMSSPHYNLLNPDTLLLSYKISQDCLTLTDK